MWLEGRLHRCRIDSQWEITGSELVIEGSTLARWEIM